ncbi:MAG: cell division topological specificity factor MinE, partial [Perlucidibaca sp.]
MSFMDFFRSQKKPSTASMAKERLQIIVAHERGRRNQPDYLPQLHRDILDVIRRTVEDRGYPPSVREIGEAVGLASPSSVAHQLGVLERKGLL